MIRCNECGTVYSNGDELYTYTEYMGECHGVPAYESFTVCPVCDSDDIDGDYTPMFYILRKSDGEYLDSVFDIDVGEQFISEYEDEDRKDGAYIPNNYDLIDDSGTSVL